LLAHVPKLTLAVGVVRSGLTLAIRPQQEMLLSQQASNRISPDVEPLPTQGSTQFSQ
jgi:hypothetical protein